MSNSKLPDHPSLEYLKKLAKDRLAELRRRDPKTKLATALLDVAREHGFPSWRALKAEIGRRQAETVKEFFEACASGDIAKLRRMLADQPDLVREREHGDNTTTLHWAVAKADVDVARALLDAGADVHGFGDLHELDVIGWATVFHEEGATWGVVPLLLERGARHHIYSAIATGDLDVIRQLVEQNPEALDRRMSRFEKRQTPLHFAMSRKRYDILDLLIELGADLEAEDGTGQTAMAVAMLHGDQEAMRRLHAAGAKQPPKLDSSSFRERMAKLAASTKKIAPALSVPDIAKALEWYTSIGFREVGRWEDDGIVNWGMVAFGEAEIGFGMHGVAGPKDVTLWFYTDEVDALYQLMKARQLEAAEAALAGKPDQAGIEFEEDIYDPFYGGRQFSIRDLNGYGLIFYKPQL
jgi:ankyrin repeat protein/catechol 2,3-dioxygenase-like lactoylglutathione lyase family enzyme